MIKEIVDVDSLHELKTVKKNKKFILTYSLSMREPDNAVKVGLACIRRRKTVCIQLDKSYKMGTIGVFEGEKIALAFDYATRGKLPVVSVIASGGIRVNEGTLALMQMAKITAAIQQHGEKGLLYVSVVTNPTLGGTSVSLVSFADIIIAEKDAIYGFSGRRIIEDTTNELLPKDFQTAEYAKFHGMVDIVADKSEIKQIISRLLQLHER
jgi:acetyl-CoA carboxylase carboxyl transferase subunit beta